MLTNKDVSNLLDINICRGCLLRRAFSAPNLSVNINLMELEKDSIKRKFNRTRSLFISISSVFFNQSPEDTSSECHDDVFFDDEEDHSVYKTDITPTPYNTPRSSCQSKPRFFISSSSLSFISSSSIASVFSIQRDDQPERYLSTTKRRFTF